MAGSQQNLVTYVKLDMKNMIPLTGFFLKEMFVALKFPKHSAKLINTYVYS